MRRLLIVVLLLASSSGARAYDDCNGQIGDFTFTPPGGPPVYVPHIADGAVVPVIDPATGPFYLDVRYVMGRQTSGWQTGVNLMSIWLYQETNGTPGLQRGGHSNLPDTPGTGDPGDPCNEASSPFCYDTTKPTCHDQRIF